MQPKTDVTPDEFIKHCEEKHEAKLIPYWKLRHPPNWDEFKEGFEDLGGEAPDDLAERQEESRKRKYWENRARKLAATPNITKDEVLTAMSGVSLNAELVELLKEHMKRAK